MYEPKYKIGETVYILRKTISGPYPHDYIYRITKTVIVNISFQVSYHNDRPKAEIRSIDDTVPPSNIVIDSVVPTYKTAHVVEWLSEKEVFHSRKEAEAEVKDQCPGLYRDAEHYDANKDKGFEPVYYTGAKKGPTRLIIIYNKANI